MQPETAISLAALYVAVIALANTLGGAAGPAAASLLGAGVAVILLASAFGDKYDRFGRILFSAMAVSAFVLGVLSGVDAADSWRDDRTKDSIRSVILDSYAAELAWYQRPNEDRRPLLERYFLPISSGGERLAVIEAAVERLRRCKYRMGREARGATFVNEIAITGSTARAVTSQSLFQPSYQLVNSKWRKRDISETFYVADQVYVLQKVDGRWLVASSPQPQSIGAC